MRALIDTCIIIDALQSRVPFKEHAQAIFLLAANRQFEGFMTAKASTDIYYLTYKYLHSDKETRTKTEDDKTDGFSLRKEKILDTFVFFVYDDTG